MTAGFKYETNWCVFTGAPSSGKTSVIEELAHRGYAVQNEVARELIEGALRQGKTLVDIRDRAHVQQLQRRIVKLKLARERGLHRDVLVFGDRGTPDSIVYCKMADLDPAEAAAAARIFHYRAVFLFDRLPLVHDDVRTEDTAQAIEIEKQLVAAYEGLGYTLNRVPVMPIAARADFILEKLGFPPPPPDNGE